METQKYLELGWALVAIPHGKKGPRAIGWNRRENQVKDPAEITGNVGLCHAYSGTCAVDIDDLKAATAWLMERGVCLADLLDADDAVQIRSGKAGSAKLLYALPDPLPTRFMPGFELRCGTGNGLTVQDVLPPSIHPETGRPYAWAGKGSFDRLPPLPDCLRDIWTTNDKPAYDRRRTRRTTRTAQPDAAPCFGVMLSFGPMR